MAYNSQDTYNTEADTATLLQHPSFSSFMLSNNCAQKKSHLTVNGHDAHTPTHNSAARTYVKLPLTEAPERKKKKKKRERCCSFEQIYGSMGIISADRSNKVTLLLTIPH